MTANALIQARLGSKRLPGKVLMQMAGNTILGHVVSALDHCRMLGRIIICTPVADLPEMKSVVDGLTTRTQWFGWDGPEEDVAGRLLAAAERDTLRHFVRICADSPMIHPAIVDHAVATHLVDGAPFTFPLRPKGQQAQVFCVSDFKKAYPKMTEIEREHGGGPYFCRPRTEINNLPGMTVDTQEDFYRVKTLMEKMPRPQWQMTWPEFQRVLRPRNGE